ncbi:MAG: cache domain-containing protein [Deltaproteobacteria bacterium]|nr:cache domain-containing protein [Deltaproteobacteria bacterium]MBW1910297.1 cache domain-containing protein [Deltaproteobacteria bacterium]MBW2034295.1 cache domain-containing protein [Deltaproteobacteria bacterium]MBW2114627.1 cache domain-containing protein [Deltaproteobacteria bacterium]
MKITFRNKLISSFFIVIAITGAFSTFIGIKLIDKSIVPRIQDKVRVDLNSAREIFQGTIDDIQDVIRLTSISFFLRERILNNDMEGLISELQKIRLRESLDILNLTDPEGNILLRTRNSEEKGNNQAFKEVIKRALNGRSVVKSTEIISEEELMKEGEILARRAYTKIIATSDSKSTHKNAETSGMFIVAAAPIFTDKNEILGVLYGGNLLNNNNVIVDRIRDTIYENEKYKGKDVGVVTIFQNNLRIATNIQTENGERAIGTIVSDEAYENVLIEGNLLNKIEFEVGDWYIAAYEPIRNISGNIIGILGMGVLESKFKSMEKNALWIFLGITFGGIILAIIICYMFANSIMGPINSLLLATRELADGNLERRIEIKNAPEEITELSEAFNDMVSSVKERDEKLRQRAQEEIMKSERLAMVGQLAAGVAHEINNPLGGILLFSRLLLQKAPSEGLFKENLERIEKDAKRCQKIVQGLLDFAREHESKMEPLELSDVMEKVVNLFENQALFHNIEIIRNYQSDLPVIFADSAQLQQVFVNILLNAADAMGGKGVLTINTRSSGINDYVEASFSDTGNGIPPDQLDRVFEPFFTTKEIGQGTGLGLSISYGIIQSHGGTIKVSSQVGRGSTFTVVLPKNRGKA